MKAKLLFLFTLLALLGGIDQAAAQETRLFRISGPVATRITEFRPDGTLVWTNAPTNATFAVQTVAFLPGGTNWVDYVQIPVTNGVNTNRIIDCHPPANMALIPAGSFTMGDSLDGVSSALPLHTVYVSAFYMDKYDVTKAAWDSVYQWATNHGYRFDYAGSGKALNHPVKTIDWYDTVKWCNARSEKEGKTPAYYTTSAQTIVYRSGQNNLSNSCVNWNAGYRLPTEVEWEKAARGGASGQRFPWGNTITESLANYYAQLSSYAYDLNPYSGYNTNYNTGAYPYTSPVGSFAANGYGLYDMAGNVWQWCWDWYGSYGSASQTDPRGVSSGSYRVNRGGSFDGDAFDCRAADRGNDGPTYSGINSFDDLGFRSVLPPGQ